MSKSSEKGQVRVEKKSMDRKKAEAGGPALLAVYSKHCRNLENRWWWKIWSGGDRVSNGQKQWNRVSVENVVRETYRVHVETKRKELDLQICKLHRLLHCTSALTFSNKRLLYMAILHPVWAYALPIWGSATALLRNIIQRFQNKALQLVTGAPWFIRNNTLHADLRVPTINEVIQLLSKKHRRRLHSHPQIIALDLLDTISTMRRLSRRHPVNLA